MTSPMTPSPDYAELRAALENATPGPWTAYPRERNSDCWQVEGADTIGQLFYCREEDHAYIEHDNSEANARFIALSRQAVPSLLARIEELEKALEPFAVAFRTLSSRWQDHEDHWQNALSIPLTVADLRRANEARLTRKDEGADHG